MKRLALFALILLSGCATYRQAEGQISFYGLDGFLYFASNTDANISHGAASVTGVVASKRATYQEGNVTVLTLPEGSYGRTVRMGRYEGAVSGEATIALVGGKEGLETELEIR